MAFYPNSASSLSWCFSYACYSINPTAVGVAVHNRVNSGPMLTGTSFFSDKNVTLVLCKTVDPEF